MPREIQWIPFGAEARRVWATDAGAYGYVCSSMVGVVFEAGDHWHGAFVGQIIGCVSDEASARASIEARWRGCDILRELKI